MAERTSLITLGLCQIKVGTAAPNGTMPSELNKIGKTYKNTCKIAQATADVTEQLAGQPRGGVIFVDEGWEIEAPAGGGGFDVEIDGWEDFIDVPLPLD